MGRREQLRHVKDLSTRLLDRVDSQDQRIEAQRQRIDALEGELKRKETMIHDLEAEAAQMIAHASNREDHVNVLKTELKELASSNDELVAGTLSAGSLSEKRSAASLSEPRKAMLQAPSP